MKLCENEKSWGDYFHQVSWRSDKRCEFFINGNFFNVSRFFYSDFVLKAKLQQWFDWNFLHFSLGSTGSSPKKHSFGKSTPPPKPKPPTFTNNKGSTGSLNHTENTASTNTTIKEEPTIEAKNDKTTEKPENSDLDLVLRTDKKLAHPTAERVKAPKRRPPSSSFQKEAVSKMFKFS